MSEVKTQYSDSPSSQKLKTGSYFKCSQLLLLGI